MLEKISSLQNPKFKRALALHSSRGRKKQERFIVFGWREVERCLASNMHVDEVFVCHAGEEAESETVVEKLQKFQSVNNNPFGLIEVDRGLMEKLGFGDRVEPVVATVKRTQTSLSELSVSETSGILVLESIEKPGNLGAIFRSADAVGMDAIVMADPMTDVFHPNSIRASMGTVFSVPTAIGTTEEVMKWLQDHQVKAYAARLDGAVDFYEADLTGHTAIVLGNEARGLSAAWESHPALKLPMNGISDSLNVSVTAAVMCYELLRQRRTSSG